MRRRLLALVAATTLVFGIAACSSSDSVGGGFTLSAGDLIASTTTTKPPIPSFTTTVATAKGATVEVFEQKPAEPTLPLAPAPGTATTAPEATPTAAAASPQARDLPPIPRKGLNTAPYAQRTDTGWIYGSPTYFENPLAFVVTEDDGDWLKVQLAARPNHTEGWIRASDVDLSQHRFHMELVLSEFTLRAWDGEDLIAETQVVIGKPATPTPVGTFYVNEKIPQKNPGGAYGPVILSTNGYSEALDNFDGGLPVLGFHGTNNPGLVGTQSSNGCVRIPNDVVTKLADTVPAGTPIEIKP